MAFQSGHAWPYLRCPYQAKVMNTLEQNSRMMVFIDHVLSRSIAYATDTAAVLCVPRRSNYLDTRPAGSYNRRPLSPGTSAGQIRPLILSLCIRPLFILRGGSKGIYGDDDPTNSHRPK